MIDKKAIAILAILFLYSNLAPAAEEPKVEIQKTEGRTEALVASTATSEPKPHRKFLERAISVPGDAVVATARLSSRIVGEITDRSAHAVQKVGGVLFAPLFKAVDIQGQLNKRQGRKKA